MVDVEMEDVEVEVPATVTPRKAFRVRFHTVLATQWVIEESDEYFEYVKWDRPSVEVLNTYTMSATRAAEVKYMRESAMEFLDNQGHFQYATGAYFHWMNRCKMYFKQGGVVGYSAAAIERSHGHRLTVNYHYDITSVTNQYLHVIVEVYKEAVIGWAIRTIAPRHYPSLVVDMDDEDDLNDDDYFIVTARCQAAQAQAALRSNVQVVARPRPKPWLQPKSWPKFRPGRGSGR